MNNEQQHTPGPWKARYLGYQYIVGIGDCIPIYATDGSGLIAFVLKKDGGIENGRLIAAAPELLEALMSIESDLDDESFNRHDWIARALKIARAAIAKAAQPTQEPDYDNRAKDDEADQLFADQPTPYDP